MDFRANEFLRLYNKKMTHQQIGDKFNLSRQRVCQILQTHPEYDSRIRMKYKYESIRYFYSQRDDCTVEEIAKMHKISETAVYKICNDLSRPKKIGCDKCDINPYARGLCKGCYERWRRAGKPEIEP